MINEGYATDVSLLSSNEKVKRKSQFMIVMKRLSYSKGAMAGFVIVLFFVIIAVLGPYITPYGYDKIDYLNKLQPPNAQHWFGTDSLGRDMLSRIIVGCRYSLTIGIGSVLISLFGGIILGSIAGFFGGTADQIIMRICDVVQSIPGIILNMAMCSVLGTGMLNTILALGISGISANSRMMRASILKIRKMEYIDAASSLNCSNLRIMWKHILPNAFSPMIVEFTMGIGSRILAASSLSYLGLGVQPPTPEWGAMLTSGKDFIKTFPHLTIIPGICILLIVLSVNLLGDGLRDALDPKQKK